VKQREQQDPGAAYEARTNRSETNSHSVDAKPSTLVAAAAASPCVHHALLRRIGTIENVSLLRNVHSRIATTFPPSQLECIELEDPVNDLRHVPDYSTGEFRHASAAIEVSKICH
jgi:hypothetical protein